MLAHSNHLPRPSAPRSSQSDGFLTTLVEVQKQIFHCQDVQDIYQNSLNFLEQSSSASRIVIVEADRSPTGELLNCWESEWWVGLAPSRRKRHAGKVSSIFHAIHPIWLEALEQGEIISGITASLSVPERELLNHEGIKSILVVPVMVNGKLYGAIRFEDAHGLRHWTASEIALLEGVAIAISLKIEALTAAAEVARVKLLQDEGMATVAHELRSPLANIQMLAQLLESSLDEEGILDRPISRASHYLQMLQTECHRKNSMINDLLALARLAAFQEPVTSTEVPLQFWVPYIAEVFQDRFERQNQYLKIDIPDDIPMLMTDMVSLERILTELLHNACKYTPEEGTILLTASMEGDRLELIITNTGVEISACDLPRIFEKFYRIPTLDVWNQGGTGLGLPLVKKLAEHLGATIEVSSAQQQVQFTLQFPL
jgi:signal transduction histidine kinase